MIHVGDITKLNGATLEPVNCITGGSPCQDLSVAGKREGLAGERSGLFLEMVRVIKEMRQEDKKRGKTGINVRPRFVIWENVPGAFTSNGGEDFRCVLEQFSRVADETVIIPRPENGKWQPAGCIVGDNFSLAWRTFDAQYWGVPQRRKRIALVADFGGESAPEILFERESMSGDITESGEPGKDAAEDVKRSVGETSKCLNGWDVQSKHIQPEEGIAEALYSGECRGGGGESYVMQSRVYGICSYDSNAMKSDNPNSGIYVAETARTLDLNGGSPACNQGGMAVVCLEGNGSRPSHRGDGYSESETMYTLNSTEHHAVAVENHPADSCVKISEDGMVQTLSGRMGTGGGNVPMVMESINGDISGTHDASYYKGCGERQGVEREVVCVGNGQLAQARLSPTVGTLNCMHDQQAVMTYQEHTGTVDACIGKGTSNQLANNDMFVANTSVVRRLTPLECERLQGFPDGWTDIGEWYDSKGKTRKTADAPRYKALGNSIALPQWQWIIDRMAAYLPEDATLGSLFDGIGGFPLCWERTHGKGTARWASEIEEFPMAVTKRHFPEEGCIP